MSTCLKIFLTLCLSCLFLTSCADKIDAGKNINSTKQTLSAIEQKLINSSPPPAQGFNWIIFQGVLLQVPSAWNIFEKDNTFCASVESIPEKGRFQTGISIQTLSRVQERAHYPASIIAMDMIKKLDQLKETTKLEMKTRKEPGLDIIIYKYRRAPIVGEPIIVNQRFEYNDKDSFINIITFEAPEDQFEKSWQNQGKIIFGKIISLKAMHSATQKSTGKEKKG